MKEWRTLAKVDPYITVPELGPERSYTGIKKFAWAVSVDSEQVYLILAEHQIGFHFETALKLSGWLRLAGKKAKQQAGDRSRSMVAIGNLTDAERNYKYGY